MFAAKVSNKPKSLAMSYVSFGIYTKYLSSPEQQKDETLQTTKGRVCRCVLKAKALNASSVTQ